jgi:hypothetical protein
MGTEDQREGIRSGSHQHGKHDHEYRNFPPRARRIAECKTAMHVRVLDIPQQFGTASSEQPEGKVHTRYLLGEYQADDKHHEQESCEILVDQAVQDVIRQKTYGILVDRKCKNVL